MHAAAAAQEPLPEVLAEARKGAGQFAVIVADVDAVCAELAGRGASRLSGPDAKASADPLARHDRDHALTRGHCGTATA